MKGWTHFVMFMPVIFIFVVMSSLGDILKTNFRKDQSPQYFPLGIRLQLYCVQHTSDEIEIKYAENTTIKLVVNSELQDQFSDKYLFEVINSTTVLLTIKELTTELNDIILLCENQQVLSANINAFDRINNVDPICTSSYGSRYIFDDLIRSQIRFTCKSQEGDPPVKILAYIRHGNEISDVTNISSLTVNSHPDPSKTLSFAVHFNSSFNNSVIFCNVFQQLPEPYRDYNRSCSFGPIIILPSFYALVVPSNISVNERDNAIVTCSSNVSEVTFDWSKIPSDWKSNVTRGSNFSELHITDYGSSTTSVILECVVTYGDRTITEHVIISVVRSRGLAGTIIVIICILLIILIIVVICLLVYRYRNDSTKCLEDITGKQFFGKNNSSKNNSNEGDNICNTDGKCRRVDDLSSNLGGGTLMIDNTIYESSNVDTKNNEVEMTSTEINKIMDQDCQMVENSIYESTSLNVEKRQNCVNPEYDTLQPDVHSI